MAMKRIKKIVALIATFTTIFTSIPTMSFAESSSPSWIDDKGSVTPTNTDDYWDVMYALEENVKLAFDKEGIEIPYNKLDVHVC